MKARLKQVVTQFLILVMLSTLFSAPVQAGTTEPLVIDKLTTQSDQNRSNRTSDVTLSIKGVTADSKSVPQDVVLVLDISNSMNATSMANLKSAALTFVNNLLGTTNSPNRVAVVSYSSSATINAPLTNNSTTLTSAINNLTAGGGTNMHAGLVLAKKLLDQAVVSKPNAPKTIIFMSDGEPTYYLNSVDEGTLYRFASKGTDSFAIQHAWKTTSRPTYPIRVPSPYVTKWEDYVYSLNYYYAGTRGLGTSFDTASYSAVTDLAKILRDSGTTIYTVGLGVTTNGRSTLTTMANTNNYKESPTSADLKAIYDRLASVVGVDTASTNTVVTDVIPNTFKLSPVNSFVKKVDGVVTDLKPNEVVANGKTITWNAGNIGVNQTITLTYTLATDVIGTKYGSFYTNDRANLSYTRYNGTESLQTGTAVFPRPVALLSPIGVADSTTVASGNATTVTAENGLLTNDKSNNTSFSEDGKWSFGDFSAVKYTDPLNGTVTVNANGSYQYQSKAGFVGTDSFQYYAQTTATNSDSKVPSVVLKSNPITVTVTVTTSPYKIQFVEAPTTVQSLSTETVTKKYTATVYNQKNEVLPNEAITYAIQGTAPAGVSINSSTGLLTVDSSAASGEITVTATSGKLSTAQKVMITAQVPTSIAFTSGSDMIQIKEVGTSTTTYTAAVADQNGVVMPKETITYSILGTLPTGVSINANTGVVIVDSKASVGSFTIVATSGKLSVKKTIALQAGFKIGISGIRNEPAVYSIQGGTIKTKITIVLPDKTQSLAFTLNQGTYAGKYSIGSISLNGVKLADPSKLLDVQMSGTNSSVGNVSSKMMLEGGTYEIIFVTDVQKTANLKVYKQSISNLKIWASWTEVGDTGFASYPDAPLINVEVVQKPKLK